MWKFAALFFLTFLISCSPSVNLIQHDYTRRPPSKHVSIYSSHDAVEWPYKEIAIIIVDNHLNRTHRENRLIYTAVAKAREIGADGIILGAGMKSLGAQLGVVSLNTTTVRAIAIKRIKS